MGFRLPEALQSADDGVALDYLREYYCQRPGTPLGAYYTGARFDVWDSTGTRDSDADRFTADDLVAVSFLSVAVPPKAAWELLKGRPAEFNSLLAEVSDRDLVDVDPRDINDTWPAWRLWEELRELRGVDWVIAGKLLARKRPGLIPVYDRVVKTVTGGDRNYWVPFCKELRADGKALHHRLLRLHEAADVPAAVPVLRVFDVIAWMEGKKKGY